MSMARKWERGEFLQADAVQDGELLVIPELLHRRHVVRDAVVAVEVHDLVVGDPDRRPVIAVQRVVVGDHRVQVVVAAGQLQDDHTRVILAAIAYVLLLV